MKLMILRWIKIFNSFTSKIFFNKRKLGFCGKNVMIYPSVYISKPKNLFLHDNTTIFDDAIIECSRARFIMKKNSGAARGLKVVTGNHMFIVGRWFNDVTDKDKDELPEDNIYDRDVIVNEDVWIAIDVTLLSGIEIGRGAIIGAGSVCRNSIPPYAIVIGNPAKVVGFKFPPYKIIEHEKSLYPENERLSEEFLEKNYKEHYLSRILEISQIIKL